MQDQGEEGVATKSSIVGLASVRRLLGAEDRTLEAMAVC